MAEHTIKSKAPVALLAGIAATAFVGLSATQSYGEDLSEVATVRLLPGWQREDGLYVAAIDIAITEGWKTYWRAPGPSGIPPQISWVGSGNLEQVGYIWPRPRVFDTFGTQTIGYEDRLILPVLMKPKDSSQPISADMEINFGVCKDICIPAFGEDSLQLDLADPQNVGLIGGWIDQRPQTSEEAGVSLANCMLRPSGDNFELTAEVHFDQDLPPLEAVVIEGADDNVWISIPDQTITGSRLFLEADVHNYADAPLSLSREAMRITVIHAEDAVDIRGCI